MGNTGIRTSLVNRHREHNSESLVHYRLNDSDTPYSSIDTWELHNSDTSHDHLSIDYMTVTHLTRP